MNQLPPTDPSPPPETSAEPFGEHSFTNGWIVFVGLIVVVVGILWAIRAFFG
jgi:hypothetical protein